MRSVSGGACGFGRVAADRSLANGPVRTGVAAAARCLALDQLAAEVVQALEHAAIPTVLLKGAGLAQRLYPDNPDQRRYTDVDLLVSPTSFDEAQQVLAGLGLIHRKADLGENGLLWYERSWTRPGPGFLTVDLHRSFVGIGDAEAFWDVVSSGAQSFDLLGTALRVPSAAACALIVGLHAAVPGPGRKPLIDLAAALALLPDSVWDQAGRFAQVTQSTGSFARGLCRNPAGAAQISRLGLRPAGTLADHLITQQIQGAAVGLAHLFEITGFRSRLRHLARHLFPSKAWMRHSEPLARRGEVGLRVAYVARLTRLAREAPRAVRDVQRAQHAEAPFRRILGPAAPQPNLQAEVRSLLHRRADVPAGQRKSRRKSW